MSAPADLCQAAVESHNYSGLIVDINHSNYNDGIRDDDYDDGGDGGGDDCDGYDGDGGDGGDGEDDDDMVVVMVMVVILATVRNFSLHEAQGASPHQSAATIILQEL